MFTTWVLPVIVRHHVYRSGYYKIPANIGRTIGGIYARIIQRAYRKYRKRPATLAKCAWNASTYDETCGDLRASDIMYSRGVTEEIIKNRFCLRLYRSAIVILLNLLFQRGYILHRHPSGLSLCSWTDIFKWLKNPKLYKYDTKEGNKIINLVKFSEYDNFYNNYPNYSYIPLLWRSNRQKFRNISAQTEKAYNMWVSLDKEKRGFKTINNEVRPKDLQWYIMEKYMLATEKSYYTFFHGPFDLAIVREPLNFVTRNPRNTFKDELLRWRPRRRKYHDYTDVGRLAEEYFDSVRNSAN
jgi:hypothetical protein